MSSGRYHFGEVAWLVSMSHDDAVACDSSPPDSWPDLLSGDVHATVDAIEASEVPVVVRWNEVHAARERVQSDLDERVARLRAAGVSESDIARGLDSTQQTVNRQFRASITAIVRELNEGTAALSDIAVA